MIDTTTHPNQTELAASCLTIDEIRANAQKNFPLGLLTKCRSVLCLFGAASKGKCDLIHLLDAGVPQITVVDDSPAKMAEIRSVFPGSWQYQVENCLTACQRLLAEGRQFDLVLCDGSAGVVDHIWEQLLPYLCDLACRQAVVKLNGEYLSLRGATATPLAVARLANELHGADVLVHDLVLRSHGKGGTYWAVVSKKQPGIALVAGAAEIKAQRASRGASCFEEIPYGRELCVPLSDLWGQLGCTQHAACRSTIDKFRLNVVQKESQSIYRAYTSKAFSQLAQSEIDQQKLTAACFDLNRFSDLEAFLEAARNATTKKGRTNREIGKAQRSGFYVKEFDHQKFAPDICAVHGSKELRGGKPMKEHYTTTGAEDEPAAERRRLPAALCALHYNAHWGVFQEDPGHHQAGIETGERLVAYIHLHRYGNHCWYSRIMGHGEYLKFGVMYLLHSVLVEKLLAYRGIL